MWLVPTSMSKVQYDRGTQRVHVRPERPAGETGEELGSRACRASGGKRDESFLDGVGSRVRVWSWLKYDLGNSK